MKISKTVDFAAAHSIANAGKCANKHGHNWEANIDVYHVAGEITRPDGFLADVRDIKDAAYKYDHDDLDKYFEYASTENVAQQIADDALAICIDSNPEAMFRVQVHLVETKNNSATAQADNVELNKLNDNTANEQAFHFVGLKGAANNTEPHYTETTKETRIERL